MYFYDLFDPNNEQGQIAAGPDDENTIPQGLDCVIYNKFKRVSGYDEQSLDNKYDNLVNTINPDILQIRNQDIEFITQQSSQMQTLVDIANAFSEENRQLKQQISSIESIEGFTTGTNFDLLINIIIFLLLIYIIIKLVGLIV